MTSKFSETAAALLAYRLQRQPDGRRGITYAALEARMTDLGCRVPARTLHFICTHPNAEPRELTRYNVERFLAEVSDAAKETRRREKERLARAKQRRRAARVEDGAAASRA